MRDPAAQPAGGGITEMDEMEKIKDIRDIRQAIDETDEELTKLLVQGENVLAYRVFAKPGFPAWSRSTRRIAGRQCRTGFVKGRS